MSLDNETLKIWMGCSDENEICREDLEKTSNPSASAEIEYVCPSCGHVTYRTVPPETITCVKCGYTWTVEKGATIEIGALNEKAKIERTRYCEACHTELHAWQRAFCDRCAAIIKDYGYVTVDWTTIPELREKWAKYLSSEGEARWSFSI